MHAAILVKYGQFKWEEADYPQIQDNEVLVKVEYASICGSDQHIFRGEFHPRTPIPFIPGHEFAGNVVEKGAKVKHINIGDRVAVDPIIWCGKCPACEHKHYLACTSLKLMGVDMNGGFAEFINVAESMLYKVNTKVPPQHAALIELLSIGYHACNRANIKKNDTVAIWGAGKVGQSILQAVKTKTKGTVIIVDILENRLNLAKKTYTDIYTINAREEDPVSAIQNITQNRGVDVAIEAVGHAMNLPDRENPVRSCIQSIRGAGTICVLGLGDEALPILMKELIWKEATLVASRVTQGEFAETIENLEKGRLKPDALITDTINPRDIQKGFEMLDKEPDQHLKIMLKFA